MKNIHFDFDTRESDSPLVAQIWRTQNEKPTTFNSIATTQLEMVITTYQGETSITVHGPETKATIAEAPPNAEFFGITFNVGTYLPHLPMVKIIDRADEFLPIATSRSFWLHGSAWQFPDFENADTFVNRLIKSGLLVNDPVVDAMLHERPLDLSIRSAQRRFKQVTGITYKTIQQIERARETAFQLQNGISIADAVYQAGYYDQAHLTNSLTRFMGQTPAQILQSTTSE